MGYNNRLEILRDKIDRLIFEKQSGTARHFISHLYSVSHFCTLLAKRRNINAELAATAGMLHDIYQVTHGIIDNHAAEGAKIAEEMLQAMNLYSAEEITTITAAIARHSKKRKIHEPFDEVLKDADVMSHCLYNPDFPISDKESERYKNLLTELGCGN